MKFVDHRYFRLEALPWIGAAGLAALHDARVAVLGLGNLGGQLALHLVLLGLRLLLVDRDVVTAANLGTQGFLEGHIGLPKAEARKRWLAPLNPACRIEVLYADLRQPGLGAWRDCAVLFSCLDSGPARVAVNEIALRLAIPWVDAGLDGSGRSLFARVAAFDPRDPECGCFLCPHDHRSLGEMTRGAERGCPAGWWAQYETTQPTLAVSALGGAAASIQALWGMKFLLGHGAEVAGKEIYIDLDRGNASSCRLARNSNCLIDHRPLPLEPVGRSTEEITVGETFRRAEERLGSGVVLQLPRRTVVVELRCPVCAARRPVWRLLETMRPHEVACTCGAAMQSTALHILDRFDRAAATPVLDWPWSRIGLPPSEVITAVSKSGEFHFLLS